MKRAYQLAQHALADLKTAVLLVLDEGGARKLESPDLNSPGLQLGEIELRLGLRDRQAGHFGAITEAVLERLHGEGLVKREPGGWCRCVPDLNVLSYGDIGLSVRASNCLEAVGIFSIAQLCQWTAEELLAVRNLKETQLLNIRDRLALFGLSLSGEDCVKKPAEEPVLENEEDVANSPGNQGNFTA